MIKKVYSFSMQGKRDSNEDQDIAILNLDNSNEKLNNINFFGVFDGHGGSSVSKYLKDNLSQFFVNKFEKPVYTDKDFAKKYFPKVFDLIQTKMKNNNYNQVQYCGSTACVGIHYRDEHNRDRLWILNVGDSRCVMCGNNNRAEQLSIDHKPNHPDEKSRIEKMGGKIEFDGADWRIKDLSLSRAFGDLVCTPYVTHLPEIFRYKITNNDKFIIFACDGVWDVLSNQDAVDYVLKTMSSNPYCDYAKALAEYAYRRGSLDNITVIIYLIEHSKIEEKPRKSLSAKVINKIPSQQYLFMG